jgi:hypothetical protein
MGFMSLNAIMFLLNIVYKCVYFFHRQFHLFLRCFCLCMALHLHSLHYKSCYNDNFLLLLSYNNAFEDISCLISSLNFGISFYIIIVLHVKYILLLFT